MQSVNTCKIQPWLYFAVIHGQSVKVKSWGGTLLLPAITAAPNTVLYLLCGFCSVPQCNRARSLVIASVQHRSSMLWHTQYSVLNVQSPRHSKAPRLLAIVSILKCLCCSCRLEYDNSPVPPFVNDTFRQYMDIDSKNVQQSPLEIGLRHRRRNVATPKLLVIRNLSYHRSCPAMQQMKQNQINSFLGKS